MAKIWFDIPGGRLAVEVEPYETLCWRCLCALCEHDGELTPVCMTHDTYLHLSRLAMLDAPHSAAELERFQREGAMRFMGRKVKFDGLGICYFAQYC